MLALIRASNEPTALALDMAHAIRDHLDDAADDDPGDDDATTLPRRRVRSTQDRRSH